MRKSKSIIWELIFDLGKKRNFSKKECRERINKTLQTIAPEYRNTEESLTESFEEFAEHEKPLWMESIEKLVEWKKTAKDRCIERTLAAEMLIKECNGDLDKLGKEQQPDLKWVNQLNKEIARRIDVKEEVLKEKELENMPRVVEGLWGRMSIDYSLLRALKNPKDSPNYYTDISRDTQKADK